MKLLLDSFWRALTYLLMPRVIGLSLLPLLLSGGLFIGLAFFFWDMASDAVRATLEQWSLVDAALKWLESYTGPSFRAVLVPMILVALSLPVVVVVTLLLVALLMTPAIVALVAQRRFADLARLHGAAWWQGLFWSLGCTAAALVALIATLPLWLIPPLVLLIPPLIWGWLTTRVMAFDALAEHASADERRAVMAAHRWPLLLMGVVTGYLGAAPALIWAFSAAALIFAPLLIAVSVWLYALVFAFSSLWFTHYLLSALKTHRHQAAQQATHDDWEVLDPAPTPVPTDLHVPASDAGWPRH
jgi:hypothetical protein